MNTNVKGVIGLTQVVADLANKELGIFLPIADTDVIDLIAVNAAGLVKRMQVKYRAKEATGCLVVPVDTVINGKKRPIDRSKLDLFGVFCPDNNKVYYVPITCFDGKRSISLRLDEPKQHQKTMLFANDYEELKF